MKAAAKITYEPERALVRVQLADSRDEDALREAAAALVALLREPKVLDDKKHPDLAYLVTTFHTPERRWVRERLFFARCARHRSIHPAMLEYTKLVNRKARKLGDSLGHGDCHPAGSFAIVPLALRDPKYIGALIDHLRGWDMDHESFHASLIEELLERHGIREETLDLLAWRAIESDGQTEANLIHAVKNHDLLDRLAEFGGIEGFAARCWKVNERSNYLPLHVGNAGRALFAGRTGDFERWLAFFEKRGLTFAASEKKPPEAKPGRHTIAAWPDDFEDDEESVP